MAASPRGDRVKEPVQVYLDRRDRSLLDELSRRTGLPRAELLRRGLRALASQENAQHAPGASFDRLLGALGDSANLPTDLAARHEDYLYGSSDEARPGAD